MFGYFGTGVIAVFRVFLMILVGINCFSTVYAQTAKFHKADIFSQKTLNSKKVQVSQSTKSEGKILIFINPQCPWCRKSLTNMDSFKNSNPQWSVQVYVMASIKEFIEFVHAELPGLPPGLDYTLDMKNMMADSYGVRRTPTYIILKQGQTKKVEGYVDLNHFSFMGQP